MNEELELRQAAPADMERILEIIRQAQAQMRAAGSAQWQDGYPAAADIARDIGCGYGYVLCMPQAHALAGHGVKDETHGMAENSAALPASSGTVVERPKAQAGVVAAYCAAVFDGEPAYERIEGAWLTTGGYVVVHRLAVADGMKGRGVATEFMRRIEALARQRGVGSFRVDTNFDNRYMLRMLPRLGFAYCGKVYYRSGERLAFEKLLGL